DGMPLGQASSVEGGQVTFQNVHTGTYHIEVEAAGYLEARADTVLPMTGAVFVEVYLKPKGNAEPVVLSGPEVPLLAPKARKEFDAGQRALSNGNLQEAQKHLENAARLAPSHPDVLYALGILYSRLNDLARAERYLGQSAELEPGQARTQAALGIVLANDHKFSEAEPPLGKALELDAKSWEARWALARCYYSERKF